MAAADRQKLPDGIKVMVPERDRIDYDTVLNINFYKKGNPYYGSLRGMRYRLIKTREEAGEGEEAPDPEFTLSIWPEPLCFEDTAPELIRTFTFPYDEEGRRAAVDKVNEMYQAEKAYWNDREENGLREAMSRI